MATDSNGVVLGPVPPGIPHIAIPFTVSISDGTAAVVEQDTGEEITQCVAMLVGSRPGDRQAVPTYGLPDPTFTGINPIILQTSTATWEPRATVSVQSTPSNDEQVVVSVKGGTN